MKKRKELALVDIFYRCWLLGILLVPPGQDVKGPPPAKSSSPLQQIFAASNEALDAIQSDDNLFDSFGAPAKDAKRSALAYLARRFHTENSVFYPLLLGQVNQYQRDGRFGHYTESPVVPNFEVPSTSTQRLDDTEDLSVIDGDLIDILWRRDIAQEKGYSFTPVATDLEVQHEHDVNLLHEKAFIQNFHNSGIQPWEHQYSEEGAEAQSGGKPEPQYERLTTETSITSQLSEEDILKDDMMWRQFLSFPPFPTKEMTQEETSELKDFDKGIETLMDFEKEMEPPVEPACDAQLAPYDFLFDGDNRLDVDEVPGCDGAIQLNDVNLHPRNMSLCRPLQQQSGENAAAVQITAEMEFLRTPSLDMTNADLASLFADPQIIDDIIDSVGGVQQVPNSLFEESASTSFSPNLWGASSNTFDFYESFSPQFTEFPHYTDEPSSSFASRMRTESDSTVISHGTSGTVVTGSSTSGSAMSSYGEELGAGAAASPFFGDATGHDHPYSHWMEETGAEVEVTLEEPEDDEHVVKQEVEEYDDRYPSQMSRGGDSRRGYKRGRDGELARQHRLPVDAAEICDMSTEEYSTLLKSSHLSREQVEVIRKIRRRGKNKLAARSSRQKKELSIAELEAEVKQLRNQWNLEAQRENQLDAAILAERHSTSRLLAAAISRSGGESGAQLNPDDFNVYENHHGELVIARKHN